MDYIATSRTDLSPANLVLRHAGHVVIFNTETTYIAGYISGVRMIYESQNCSTMKIYMLLINLNASSLVSNCLSHSDRPGFLTLRT